MQYNQNAVFSSRWWCVQWRCVHWQLSVMMCLVTMGLLTALTDDVFTDCSDCRTLGQSWAPVAPPVLSSFSFFSHDWTWKSRHVAASMACLFCGGLTRAPPCPPSAGEHLLCSWSWVWQSPAGGSERTETTLTRDKEETHRKVQEQKERNSSPTN